jgi:PAS domain S-box-containing protein
MFKHQGKRGEFMGAAELRPYVFGILLAWTLIVGSLITAGYFGAERVAQEFARVEARAAYDKDLVYRRWAAGHGGVYAPVTKDNPPNPYLADVPERDITTPGGRPLTLINPAYMTRQVHELAQGQYGIRGHITSLNPLRRGNAPDAWETRALQAFAQGKKEVSSVGTIDGKPYMRLMQPMFVEDRCLKCHARQGYKVGEIRGGISTSVPLAPFRTTVMRNTHHNTVGYGILWLLGVVGTMIGGRSLGRRLTAQKEAEKFLQESEERLQRFAEVTTEGICFHNQGNIVDANPAFASLMGCSSATEVIGRSVLDFIDPSFHGKVREKMTQQEVAPWGLTFRRTDGTELPVEASAREYELGPRRLRVVCIRDISEHKRAAEEIRHLKNYLANIIDSMPSALVGMDMERIVTQWNRQAEAITGIPAQEAIGKPVTTVIPEFSPWIESMGAEAKKRHPAALEKLLLEKDGERHFYDLMLYPLVANCVEGSVIRIEDVTERARIQELMVQTEKMMSIGGLAAGMAHEINNPLGIILQAAQNIERRVDPDFPANRHVADELGFSLETMRTYFANRQIDRFIDSIREASSRTAKIVANILDFSHRSESIREPASLPALMDQALELAANDYDLKKKYDFRAIEVIRDYSGDMPQVPVIAVEIEQVLLNLLKNAAQAMADNPPERKPRIVVRIRREEKYAVLDVEDNGPGMTVDVRRRVFEPFFTTKEVGVGTGLGLSISYMIVTQNHKGLLEVESTPGNGARFTVRLPLE